MPGAPPLPLSFHTGTGRSLEGTSQRRGTTRQAVTSGGVLVLVVIIPSAMNAGEGGRGRHTHSGWSPTCTSLTTDQSDAGSAGIFSRRTNRNNERRVRGVPAALGLGVLLSEVSY
eukprot:3513878-Pyramimonas_sp.AAC.1